MTDLLARLEAVERRLLPAVRIRSLWCDYGETAEEVIAREYPGGVPSRVQVRVYCWRDYVRPERDAAVRSGEDDPAPSHF